MYYVKIICSVVYFARNLLKAMEMSHYKYMSLSHCVQDEQYIYKLL